MPKLRKKSYSQKLWADQTRKWLSRNVLVDGSSPQQTHANPPDIANTGQNSQAVECGLTITADASHMNTTTQSYHPASLTQLIGDYTTEVPDDVIVAALELMKANCDADTSEYYGYYKPAAILTFINSYDGESVVRLPVNKNSIHIHPLTRH
ncbi:hypothetical protein DPMN_017562 [Dreissena polymorpha]|uniref:Uncharacterized protein n=1 Tax=Dreissena polymorpha TaxID=45954 RepID=A0A9D4S7F9_DREPO|nr:hypothetical protein DPMN_017562 [Dreissena polymorpha]